MLSRNNKRAVLVGLAICLSHRAAAVELTVVARDLAGTPLQDAVIYVQPVNRSLPPAAGALRSTIDQVNKQFVPLVTVLRIGTEVSFPNSDNIRHSIYSFSKPKTFTTKLYSGRQAPPMVFDQPGLVVLGCNIHDTMAAWVLVLNTPFFTKSGVDGTGTLRDLEAGDYTLSVWYPRSQLDPVSSSIHLETSNRTQVVELDATGSLLPALRARGIRPPP